MFTESVRIGCSFMTCYGGWAKYQTLTFHDSLSGPLLSPHGNRPDVDL